MSKVYLVYYITNGEAWYFDSKKSAKAFIKKAIADNPKDKADSFSEVHKDDFDEIEEFEVFTETNLPIFNG